MLLLVAFLICLASYIVHTLFHFETIQRRYLESKGMEAIITIIVFAGYFAWGFMNFSDPVKMELNNLIAIPLGLLIGLSGFTLIIWSSIAKKGFGKLNYIVTKGIYSKLRNPMYLGVILLHIGIPILTKSLLTLVSSIIWVPIILLWKCIEEEQLEKKFGSEYAKYKSQTYF